MSATNPLDRAAWTSTKLAEHPRPTDFRYPVPAGSRGWFANPASSSVGRQGFEPWTNGLKRPESESENHDSPQKQPDRRDEGRRKETEIGPSLGDEGSDGDSSDGKVESNRAEADPIEAALADALRRAAIAGAWDSAAALTAELRARREARAGVVSLDAARRKRES